MTKNASKFYTHQPGDGWVHCACGSRHWGLHGAAGLLLIRRDDHSGAVREVVLQHRASWSHFGDTWGIPGGARQPGESASAAALRESAEEALIPVQAVRVLGEHTVTHPDWSYVTVVGEELPGFNVVPGVGDSESAAVSWVALSDLDRLPLLPAFAAALPELLDLV